MRARPPLPTGAHASHTSVIDHRRATAMSHTDRTHSKRTSLQGALPPIGSMEATGAAASVSAAASTSAMPLKAFQADLLAVDRTFEERRRRAGSHTAREPAQGHSLVLGFTPNTAENSAVPEITGFRGSVGAGAAHEGTTGIRGVFGGSSAAPLRLPTPLPHVRPIDDGSQINLNLPRGSSGGPAGALSAPSTSRGSSLAALTQEGNTRLSQFLDQYGQGPKGRDERRSAMLPQASGNMGDNSSMRLLLYGGLVRLSAKELEEEKEVSRLLLSWHPQRSAKAVASVQHKIKSIMAEHGTTDDSSASSSGPTIVGALGRTPHPLADDQTVREELSRKGSMLFKLAVPLGVPALKLDLELVEGKAEVFVSCGGEIVVTAANYAREKNHSWVLRAGTQGHHLLQLNSLTDAAFKSGQDFMIYVSALTNVTFQMRVNLAPRTRFSDSAAAHAAEVAAAAASAADEAPLATFATNGGISLKNMRRVLAERIKLLSESPQKLRAFHAHVAKIKARGLSRAASAAAAAGSLNSKPPAHLTLNQLKAINAAEAVVEAAAQAKTEQEQERLADLPSSPTNRNAPDRNARASAVSSPRSGAVARAASKPAAIWPPVALTPFTLDVIPHIAAISGVSSLFFETARELTQPTPLLDEHDCIAIPASSSTLPSLHNSPLMVGRGKNAVALGAAIAAAGGSAGGAGVAAASAFPPVLSLPGGMPPPLTLPPSITAASSAAPSPTAIAPPKLERAPSLSNVMQSFIMRVCKRIRVRAAQLLLLGKHSSAAHSHGAATTPGPSPTPDEVAAAADESRFLSRCLSIYTGHFSEIESILLAHASGDRSNSAIARLLPASSSAGLRSAEKNFLLVNAFEATDNKAYAPRVAARRKQEWHEAHNQRMINAAINHSGVLQEKREMTLSVIERKERDRERVHAAKLAAEAQRLCEERQTKWLRYVAAALRHSWLRQARLNLHPMRVESFRKSHAAKKIQSFVRTALLLRRRTRATLHFQALRSVALMCAYNYSVVKYNRAADCIKLFIEQKKGVDSVSRLVKNFRRRVGICQRSFRNWQASKRAKIELWKLQVKRAILTLKERDAPAATILLSTHAMALRDDVLRGLFAQLKTLAISGWSAHEEAMAVWRARVSEERAKATVLADHVQKKWEKPDRPRVPIILSEAMLVSVMEQITQRTRDLARLQLQNTTDSSEEPQTSRPVSRSTHGEKGAGNGGAKHKKKDSTLTVESAYNGAPRPSSSSKQSAGHRRSRSGSSGSGSLPGAASPAK